MISFKTLLRVSLALLLGTGAAFSAVAETNQAYVHFGAVVLGDEPAGNHSARRPRVGYLPIGTVVSYDAGAPKTRIFNYAEDVYENYLRVRSSLGFEGFIRDDLVTELDDRAILVPLGYNINIRALDSDAVLTQISRAADKHGSTPVEVIGEEAEYYHVRLARADAAIIEGRISRPLVDGGRLVKLSNHSDRFQPDIRLGSPAQFVDERLADFGTLVSERAGESAATIVEFLRRMNALRCRVSTTADAQLSAKIFGTGLGLRFDFVLAERNAIYAIKTLSYSLDGRDYTSFYELHDVRCVDGIPHRLANLVLVAVDDPSRQIIVSLEDLPAGLKSNWVRFDTDSSRKMIVVDGFKAYDEFMQHIGQSGLLRDLPYRDRLVLSHALLRELAHFSTPN